MISWAVVGTGRVAQHFVAALAGAHDHRIIAVVGRSSQRAAGFCMSAGIDARPCGSVRELLDTTPPDIVYIASPNPLHESHVGAMLRAGIPVLCEKPLAPDLPSALRIAQAVESSPTPFALAFQYRQHPAHRRAREIVESGMLGDLRMVDVVGCLPELDVPGWYDDAPTAGGGILPMSGVHRVDIARFLTGLEFSEVQAVTAHRRRACYDDTAAIVASLPDDGTATFQFGLDAPFGDDRIALHGTEGSLVLSSTMSQWWSDVPGTLELRDGSGSTSESFAHVDNYALQIESFARFVRGDREAVVATAADGVAAARFTDAVYRSASTLP